MSSSRAGPASSPRYSTSADRAVRSEGLVVVLLLGRRRRLLRRYAQRPPGAAGDLDRFHEPLLGHEPADIAEPVPGLLDERGATERQPVVDDRPGHGGLRVRLRGADRDEARGRVGQQPVGPRLVDPAMERDDRRDGEGSSEDEAGELEMGVDDVERAGLAQDGQLGRQEVRGGLRRQAERSERARHDRYEPGRGGGSPLANSVTSWPRRPSSVTRVATIRSVPP